jgi:subtilisin-like proprotein convertase family protein
MMRRFRWLLAAAVVAAAVFTAGSQAFRSHGLFSGPNINTPDNGTANPYPSSLQVSGLDGVIDSMTVTMFITHTNPDDLDILLVGPTGKKVLLMSDAGGTTDLSNKQVRFKDGAAALPDSTAINQVEYRPTNFGSGDVFPAPAPGGTPSSDLFAFDNTDPNGIWSLYVLDDSPGGGTGTVNSWRVTINTKVTIQGAGFSIPSVGSASQYPSLISVASFAGVVSRIEVRLNGVNHTNPDDIDVLLLGPNGKRARLMSDAGGDHDLTNVNLRFTDIATSELPNSDQIVSGSYQPTNYGLGDDNFPSPAPGTPYENDLASAFNGDRAQGNWRLFVADDNSPGSGSISNWSLTIVTTDQPPTATAPADQVIDLGQTRNLSVTASDPEGDPLSISLALNPIATLDDHGDGTATLHLAPQAGDAGNHQLRVTASDGDFTTSDSFNVTVNDVTPPTTTATPVPAPNAAGWNTGSVDVGLSAIDLGSAVQSITYSAAGAQTIPQATVNGSSVALPTITAEGITTITFHATDTEGNVEANQTRQIKIDKTKPVFAQQMKIKLDANTQLSSGNIPVTLFNWLGSDPGSSASGLDHYVLSRSVNGASFNTLALSDPLATTDTRLVTPGTTVKFQIQAADVAGNLSNASGTPTEGVELHQESDPAIVDTGTWTTANAGYASGSSTQFASAAGAKATFSFTGPHIAWVSAVGPDRGIAEVRVDGALKATVDLFNATQQGVRLVFVQNNIGDVAHSIEIKVLGTKNASSTGTKVDVDAFAVLNPP